MKRLRRFLALSISCLLIIICSCSKEDNPVEPITPPGTAPAQVVLTSPQNGAVNLELPTKFQWNSLSDAVSYHIQIATDQNFTAIVYKDSSLASSSTNDLDLVYFQKYFWRVRAKNKNGIGQWSSVFDFTTKGILPLSVGLNTPANGSTNISTAISLSWGKGQFADTYHVQLATVQNFQKIYLQDSTLTVTAYSVSNLPNDQVFYWRVRGKNKLGYGSWSDVFQFTTIGTQPSQVQLVSPGNGATDIPLNPQLQWTTIANAATYHLQISSMQNFSSFVYNDSTLKSNIYGAGGLAANQKYYWRVRAKNSLGIGQWSVTFEFTTAVNLPEKVQLSSPADNSVNLALPINFQWSAAKDASTYHLQISSASNFQTLVYQDSIISSINKSISTLSAGQKYYWRVRGKNAKGTGVWSDIFNFTTMGMVPAQVQLTSPSNGKIDVPITSQFQWSAVQNTVSYHIQISSSPNFQTNFFQDSTLTSTSVTVNNLPYNQKYYWRVRAKNSFGIGAWSAAFNFTTIGNLPGQVQLSLPTNGATNILIPINFQWTNVTSATSYHLQVSTSSNFQSISFQDSLLTGLTLSVGTLSFNQKYFWRVRAKNNYGTGAWSTIYDFTTMNNLPDQVQLVAPSLGTINLAQPITFQWKDITGASSYHIQFSTTTNFQNIFYQDSLLTGSSKALNIFYFTQKYYWRVRAKNNYGTGLWSQVSDFTTAASPLVATWKMTKVTVNLGFGNIDLTPEQAGTQMTIICRSDRTFEASLTNSSGTTVDTGTWTATDKQLTLNYSSGSSETLDYTLQGTKLVVKNKLVPGPNNSTIPATLEFTKQ